MPRTPFWLAPGLAFHSERPYVAAARRWRGLALAYILLLAVVVWLPSAASLQRDLDWIRDTFVPSVADDLPRIEIRGGEAHVMAETPVELTGPQGDVVAILDPAADRSALERLDGGLLLTRDHLYLETFEGVRSLDLATVGDLTVTRDNFAATAEATTRWLGLLLYPVGAGIVFIYRLVQALVYALATLVLARTVGTALTYAAAVRVTAVALTPVMALTLLQGLFGFTVPAWWVVSVATAFIYIYFGVRGIADATPESVEDTA